jgi:hypothetical protein
MVQYWASFAKYGIGEDWPQYDPAVDNSLAFVLDGPTVLFDFEKEFCVFWDFDLSEFDHATHE